MRNATMKRNRYFRRCIRPFQFSVLMGLLLVGLPAVADEKYLGYSNYQIVTDFSFDAAPYFAKMETNGVNLQRIWVLGYSNSAGEIGETMPFALSGNKYDLTRIDARYLDRLKTVLRAAQEHGQQVLLTLFDHWSLSTDDVFPKSPWYFKNNTNKLLRNPFPEFYDLRNRKLVQIQRHFVTEIVRAAAPYSPIYEIMNEAGGADCTVMERWHKQAANWIRQADRDARIAVNVRNGCNNVLNQPWVDIVSFHADDWQRNGICTLAEKYNDTKTVIIDTDGAWKVRHDNALVRDWLKETVSCGASFNHKDDIYDVDDEALSLLKEARESMYR